MELIIVFIVGVGFGLLLAAGLVGRMRNQMAADGPPPTLTNVSGIRVEFDADQPPPHVPGEPGSLIIWHDKVYVPEAIA